METYLGYLASDRARREDSNALILASGGRNLTPFRTILRFGPFRVPSAVRSEVGEKEGVQDF